MTLLQMPEDMAMAAVDAAAATGLDFSSAMLAVARARDPAIALQQGDAERLPLPDSAFEAAVSNFGIHHAPNPVNALAEVRRVLRGWREMLPSAVLSRK